MEEIAYKKQTERIRHLLVLKDLSGPRQIPLESSSYFIGRDPKSSIVIHSKAVSRQHAIILRVTGSHPEQYSYVLIDGNLQGKRSTNGVHVNKEKCISTRLQPGDLIQFGSEVTGKYLTLSNLTDQEFKHYCTEMDPEDLMSTTGEISNPKATLVVDAFPEEKGAEDVSILRMASFPEIIPSPMFEVTVKGQLTYVNPAATEAFPKLSILGLEHPVLMGLLDQIAQAPHKKSWSREIDVEGQFFEQSVHYIPENGLVRCCLFDITARKQAEQDLRRRDQLSQSVAEASTYLLSSLSNETAIAKAMEMFAKSIGVDRISISQNHQEDKTQELASSLKYEWCNDNIPSLLNRSHRKNQIYSQSYLKRWYAILAEDQLLNSLRQALPDAERSIMFRDQILSLLVIPIKVQNSFWGFLELDNCTSDYEWTTNDEANVRAFAASIGAALQRQHHEQIIQHQAFHDALTGLPNRVLFSQRLDAALLEAQQNSHSVAVMFLDLDKFKNINDTLGHSVGDGLLQEVAQRLCECVRTTDTVARWGGDEFTILMGDLNTLDDAVQTARKILSSFQNSYLIEQYDLFINTSIGIAFYPNDALEAEVLVRNADIALYQSKEMGRGTYRRYQSNMNSDAPEIFSLRNSLRQGLERDEFLLYYQPQLNLVTGEIVGMETLIRWNHPDYGLIFPSRFLPIAEESGVIKALGDWILRTACQQLVKWHDMGYPSLSIAVNLSLHQFVQGDLVESVSQILQDTHCPPSFLHLEISEVTATENLQYTQDTLRALQSLGVKIALDDFGTGQSSLTHLSQLSIDTIKINQCFIQDVQTNNKSAAIIKAVLSLARHLNLDVIAEGVDKPEKLAMLKAFQCQYAQGYLISPPLPTDQATERLQGNRMDARALYQLQNSEAVR